MWEPGKNGTDDDLDPATSSDSGELAVRVDQLESVLRGVRDELVALLSEVGAGDESVNDDHRIAGPMALPNSLSPRRREVATLLIQGMTVERIANRLGLSRHTVRNHLKAVYRTVGVHSSAELVRRYRA